MVHNIYGKAKDSIRRYRVLRDTRKFEGYPQPEIPAYELISRIIQTDVNCLMLLDCYIPTRWGQKWTPGSGTFEILASGRPFEHVNGKKAENDPGDFTRNICVMIDRLVKGINTDFKGYKKPLSIPYLLKNNVSMSANPIPFRFKKTEDDDETVGRRIVFNPGRIREDKTIQLFSREGTGRYKKRKLEADNCYEEAGPVVTEDEVLADEGVADVVEEEGLFVSDDSADGGLRHEMVFAEPSQDHLAFQ